MLGFYTHISNSFLLQTSKELQLSNAQARNHKFISDEDGKC